MTKIEETLVLLEKNNEITNVTPQTIKLFENLIVEGAFQEKELKGAVKELCLWFNDRYEDKINKFEYNSYSEKIMKKIKEKKLSISYSDEIDIFMKMESDWFPEEKIWQKILYLAEVVKQRDEKKDIRNLMSCQKIVTVFSIILFIPFGLLEIGSFFSGIDGPSPDNSLILFIIWYVLGTIINIVSMFLGIMILIKINFIEKIRLK